MNSNLSIGKLIFINGIHNDTARYLVSGEKESNENFIIDYEIIEQCCNVLIKNHRL